MVLERISLYLRNGSPIFGCLLDCTKTFDTVQHSLLFKKLIEVKIPEIFVRGLIFIYQKKLVMLDGKVCFHKNSKCKMGSDKAQSYLQFCSAFT